MGRGRGVTLFQKVGVPIFVSFGSLRGTIDDIAPKARESRRRGGGVRGGGFTLPAGVNIRIRSTQAYGKFFI